MTRFAMNNLYSHSEYHELSLYLEEETLIVLRTDHSG